MVQSPTARWLQYLHIIIIVIVIIIIITYFPLRQPIASYKVGSSSIAISCVLFQFSVSSRFLRVISSCLHLLIRLIIPSIYLSRRILHIVHRQHLCVLYASISENKHTLLLYTELTG
jgi:hypothetical protein